MSQNPSGTTDIPTRINDMLTDIIRRIEEVQKELSLGANSTLRTEPPSSGGRQVRRSTRNIGPADRMKEIISKCDEDTLTTLKDVFEELLSQGTGFLAMLEKWKEQLEEQLKKMEQEYNQ
jgi:hypothetical protein